MGQAGEALERREVGDAGALPQPTRIAEVEAVIAYRTALVALYLSEGSLLTRHGVTIEG